MKTPTQLKNEHQLSNTEINKQANDLINEYIEPIIVDAIKKYKNQTSINLATQIGLDELVSIRVDKYTKPTPLGNHLVNKCIEILNTNGYNAYIDENAYVSMKQLIITW